MARTGRSSARSSARSLRAAAIMTAERNPFRGTILVRARGAAVKGPVAGRCWTQSGFMDRGLPSRAADVDRRLSRRDVLKLGAMLAGGAAQSALAAACAPRREPGASAAGASPGKLSGPLTMIAGGDPLAEPPLRKLFEDFARLHPGVVWDVRALSGAGPEWDRLARALVSSGEPV